MSNEKNEPSVVDQFVQNNPTVAAQGVGPPPVATAPSAASLWPRFLARLIDNVILFVAALVLGRVLSAPISFLVSQIFGFLYAGYFYQEMGATPGKLAMGISVVDHETGQRLSFFRGGLRDSVGHLVSGIILGIGYLMIFFTSGHRALHDFLFNTRVIPAPEQARPT